MANSFNLLNQIDIVGKDLRLVRNLYWEPTAAITIQGNINTYKPIQRDVQQVCVPSTDLFNLDSEIILRNIENRQGAKVLGRIFNNLR